MSKNWQNNRPARCAGQSYTCVYTKRIIHISQIICQLRSYMNKGDFTSLNLSEIIMICRTAKSPALGDFLQIFITILTLVQIGGEEIGQQYDVAPCVEGYASMIIWSVLHKDNDTDKIIWKYISLNDFYDVNALENQQYTDFEIKYRIRITQSPVANAYKLSNVC